MCVLRATHELFNFIDDFTVLPISTYMLPSKFTAQNLVRMHLMLKLISIPTAAFTIVFLGSQNSHGQSTSSPNNLSEIYACADIADSTARLACYDASVGRLETAEKSGDIVTLSRSTIDQVKKDSFGLKTDSASTIDLLTKSEPPKKSTELTKPISKKKEKKAEKKTEKRASLETEDLNKVNLEIASTKTFGYEKTRFYLANGQVWDQVDSVKVRVPRVKDGNPNVAEIKKAALGSFFLRINGKGRAIRIRRKK